jgi:hypothetical protein
VPFSYAQYAGNGSTTTFSVPFPYLLKAHVKLYTGFNILSGAYTTLLVDGTDYTWTSTTQVQTTVAPANGVTLTVLRDTPDSSQLVPWQDGSNLVADDMNIADLQNLYVVQEQQDRNDVGITQSTNAINAANNAVATANAAAAAVTNVYLRDGSLPMTADVATGGFKVRDVGAPAVGTDAATKSYVDNFVGSTANIANGAVTTAKLADSSVTSAKIADGTIVAADLATDSVTTAKITDGSVTEAKLATDSVTTAKVANAAVTAAKLATDSVTTAKVADGAITNAKLADADLQTLAGAQTGAAAAFAALTAAEVATLDGITSSTAELNILDGVTADATEINKLDGLTASTSELSQLAGKTISGTLTPGNVNDIPTSSAVNSWVSNLINALGGFVAIANRNSFPTENPDPSDNAGTVVSIADAGGLIVSAGGTATNAQTTGAVAVTITGFPAAYQSKTLNAGLGIQVQTTTTLNTYTFHKSIPTDADIAQLSDDVNDFFARYRIGTTNPTTDLDAGDLFFNTSTGKMLVYDGTTSSWEEVQSIGNFTLNTLSSSAGAGGGSASFNGTAYRFTLSSPPLFAQQLLVSVNGVVQKPNSGTVQPAEGYAIDGNDIVFSQAPATSSPFFIVTMGSTVNIGTPSDGTVSTPKLADSAVTTAKIDNGAVTTDKIAAGAVVEADLADGAVTSAKIADGTIANIDISASAGIAVSKLAASTISGVALGGSLASATFNNGGAGAASGSTYDGGSALTVSYNTLGAPSITGTNASGTWGISVTGNSGTATTLQTARTINGVSFNGSANITLTANTPSSITFNNGGGGGGSGSTFNGGAALTVSYNTVGAPSTTGANASGTWGINVTGSSGSCTGNSATASQLTTAGGSAPSYAARAWVNFGSAGGINASGNVSSVGKTSAGLFTINFSTGMPTTAYSAVISGSSTTSVNITVGGVRTYNTGSAVLDVGAVGTGGAVPSDRANVCVAIFC